MGLGDGRLNRNACADGSRSARTGEYALNLRRQSIARRQHHLDRVGEMLFGDVMVAALDAQPCALISTSTSRKPSGVSNL